MSPNKRNFRGELGSRKIIANEGRGGARSKRGRGIDQGRGSGSARGAPNQSVVVRRRSVRNVRVGDVPVRVRGARSVPIINRRDQTAIAAPRPAENPQQEREDRQQLLEVVPPKEPEENVVDQEEAGCSVGPQDNRRRRHRPNCPLYRDHPNYQRRRRELTPEPAVEKTSQPWSISALVGGIVNYVSGSLSPRTETGEESSLSTEPEDVGEEEELSDSQQGTEATSEASNKSTSSRSTDHGSGEESHIDSDSESSDFDICCS